MSKLDINDILGIPEEYNIVSKPKLAISDNIRKQVEKKSTTLQEVAESVGLKYENVTSVTSVHEYSIDTLLKVLHGLDMELVVRPKN